MSDQDSGAIGRLNEVERFDLIEAALLWFPTGEGLANPQAWAIQVADHAIDYFAAIVREHTDRALAEVEQRIESAVQAHRERGHREIAAAMSPLPDLVRAARQEQGRG